LVSLGAASSYARIIKKGERSGFNNMKMNFEHHIAASREQVWVALNDTEILKAAITGCSSLETTGENSFNAQVTAKVGPVKAKFSFDVSLSDIDPPNGYTIAAEGQGGAAGFAKGGATVSLREDGDETILAYSAKANVGGKLAQLGSRLIDGAAQKIADEFFVKFSELAADPTLVATEQSEPEDKPMPPVWVWVVGLLALTVLGLLSIG
jgi:carbon monoxide dehydrogenase subunit G